MLPNEDRERVTGVAAMAKLSGWRKIAGAMWGPPDDPQMYGILEFDATPLIAFQDAAKAAGQKITATHFVGRAIANALHEVPDFNVRIRGSKVIPRETVDVFFIAAVEGGRELSGVRVDRTDEKSVFEVAAERAVGSRDGDETREAVGVHRPDDGVIVHDVEIDQGVVGRDHVPQFDDDLP